MWWARPAAYTRRAGGRKRPKERLFYVARRTTPSWSTGQAIGAATLSRAYGKGSRFSGRGGVPAYCLLVHVHQLRRDVRPVEIGRAARAGFAQAAPQLGVLDQAFEGAGQGVGVLRLHQEPGGVSLYDTLVAVDVRGHDRAARGHRLEQHDPERLLSGRRRAEDVE